MTFNPDDIITFESIPAMDYDTDNIEYIDLDKQLNDDVPPPYTPAVEMSHKYENQYTTTESIWDENFNTSNNYNKSTKLEEELKQIRDDFGNRDNIFDENMIQIYENPNVDTVELNDISFKDDVISEKFNNLTNIQKFMLSNSKLSNICNVPQNLTHLILNKCNLSIIDCAMLSPTIKLLNLSHNKIILITNINPNIDELILDSNELEYISDLPPIRRISIKSNKIKDTTMFKDGTSELDLNNNCIEDIEGLPNSIQMLDVARNPIIMIILFPECIKVFVAYNCRISKIQCEFPETLEKLDLYNNMLESIPPIPQFLKWIDVSENDMKIIPYPLNNVEYLDISNNEKLKDLPIEAWKHYMDNSLNRTYQYDKKNPTLNINDNILTSEIEYDSSTDSDISTDVVFGKGEFKEIVVQNSNQNSNVNKDTENDESIQLLIKKLRLRNTTSNVEIKKSYKDDKANYIELQSTYTI